MREKGKKKKDNCINSFEIFLQVSSSGVAKPFSSKSRENTIRTRVAASGATASETLNSPCRRRGKRLQRYFRDRS
jgi:hypothetical protein